jgi:hypothetical protein
MVALNESIMCVSSVTDLFHVSQVCRFLVGPTQWYDHHRTTKRVL